MSAEFTTDQLVLVAMLALRGEPNWRIDLLVFGIERTPDTPTRAGHRGGRNGS
jgi:hypothetical protein